MADLTVSSTIDTFMQSANVAAAKTAISLNNVTNDAQLTTAQLDTDGTLAANSDSKVPSQKAVKTYVDAHSGGASGPQLPTWEHTNGTIGAGLFTTSSSLVASTTSIVLSETVAVNLHTVANGSRLFLTDLTTQIVVYGLIESASTDGTNTTFVVSGMGPSGSWTSNIYALSFLPTTQTKDQIGLGSVTNDAQLRADQLTTDDTFSGADDAHVPSALAVKTYVDDKLTDTPTFVKVDVNQNSSTDYALKVKQSGTGKGLIIQRDNGGAEDNLLEVQNQATGILVSIDRDGGSTFNAPMALNRFSGSTPGFLTDGAGNAGFGSSGFNSQDFLLFGGGALRWKINSDGSFESYPITTPSAPSSNCGLIYVKDVAGTAEWFVMDAAGNETQISAHAQDGPEWLSDSTAFGLDRIVSEKNVFTGQVRFTNETRGARLLELTLAAATGDASAIPKLKALSADQMRVMHTETFSEYGKRTGVEIEAKDWDANQAEQIALRQVAVDAWDTTKTAYDAAMKQWAKDNAKAVKAGKEPPPKPPEFTEIRPEPLAYKNAPDWLKPKEIAAIKT